MQATDVERTVQAALPASSLKSGQRPRILSDNGSAYVSRYLKEYLKGESIEHVRSAASAVRSLSPNDTAGPPERERSNANGPPSRHRSMKNVLLLEHYYSPDELSQRLTEWVAYYNRAGGPAPTVSRPGRRSDRWIMYGLRMPTGVVKTKSWPNVKKLNS